MSTIVLIHEPDEVISLDLSQTIRDVWPDGTVISCRNTGQALARLMAGRLPHVIILHQSLRAAQASGLAGQAVQRDVGVLFTAADPDEAAEIERFGWRAVEMPYTTDQVQGAVRDLMALRDETIGHCKAAALG